MSRMTYFYEQLAYIADVTRMLNALPFKGTEGVYVHVELREQDTHRLIGEWSDEIAGDAWYFAEKDTA